MRDVDLALEQCRGGAAIIPSVSISVNQAVEEAAARCPSEFARTAMMMTITMTGILS